MLFGEKTAKANLLELMMTAEGDECNKAECINIQLLHGQSEYGM